MKAMNGICNTQGKGSTSVPTVRQSERDHRKGSLSIAIHEKFEHNLDNKYFSDLEKYGSPTFPFHNSFKRNPMIKYEYQFKENNLGVIPFYSH